ncbi:universal stress protein [Streptomyces sp. TR06-5]|uniref:universal stress protein n=1 Tax=unclassified Streptomyces TaxID=2593676 RepID=UPI0039A0355A
MELPLVVATDGSSPSLAAVDWAADEATRHGRELRIVHASLWERYENVVPDFRTGRPPLQTLAEHIVASAAERAGLRQPALKVTTEILPQEAEAGLVQESYEAFAVVTGHRGRGGFAGLLLGSVSLAVASRAHCPVVVVRGPHTAWEDTARPVVLGVGDLTEGSAAHDFAFREAAVRRSPLLAVRSWRSPATQTLDHPLFGENASGRVHEERAASVLTDVLYGPQRDHPEVEVRRRVEEGPPHRVLLERAEEGALLVIGAPRRHGHTGLQLGRVSHAALHHAACPVVVVPAAS